MHARKKHQLKLPKLRHQKSRNCCVVRLDGKDHYGPKWNAGDAESWYQQLISDYLHRQQALARLTIVSVRDMTLQFLEYSKARHKPETSSNYARACRYLCDVAGDLDACQLTLAHIESLRDIRIAAGNRRKYINDMVGRVKQLIKWSQRYMYMTSETVASILALEPISANHPFVTPSEPVRPVSIDLINQVLPHLNDNVGAMIRLQLYSGARPGEIIRLKPERMDTSDDVWIYRPDSHKTDSYGHIRQIAFGPKSIPILETRMDRPAGGYAFNSDRHDPASCYSKDTYGRAIRRGCERAGVSRFTPHQLRHTAATFIQQQYGITGAQLMLGHSSPKTTAIYAQQNLTLQKTIAQALS